MNRNVLVFVALAFVVVAPARALELADGKLSVGGNGQWAYQRTNGNTLTDATKAGNYDTGLFDLVVSARPTPELVLNAMLGFDPGETSAEWVFAEWRASDLLRVRVGKVKQPLGNYMELEYVGIARPFFNLPLSVYGPANIGATSYLGAGVTGAIATSSGWELAYDAYGGQLEFNLLEPYMVLKPGAPSTAIPLEPELEHARDFGGARLSLTTPWGVVFRLSGFGGTLRAADMSDPERFIVYGGSVWYRGEAFWVSAEAFRSDEPMDKSNAGYVEVAYFVLPKLQVALRGEMSLVQLRDRVSLAPNDGQLLRHEEAALGVNYWATRDLAFKISYHEVRGNRFAVPATGDLAQLRNSTRSVVAGAQFAF